MANSPSCQVPKTARVLLVDDHDSFREWLREYLEEQPDFQVVAEAADGPAAVLLAQTMKPDVVLMDVVMPESGIEATRRIKDAHPSVRVIALSMYRQRRFVEAMLAAGASGYLLKDNVLINLPCALRTVINGGTYLCTQVNTDMTR